MAKKYYKKRYYNKKGRWSANINDIVSSFALGTNLSYLSITLCQNPVQDPSTVSQQFTVKNVELTYNIEGVTASDTQNAEVLSAYIMYVPQGMSVNQTYPFTHPEYIMAYRWLGSPDADVPYRNPLYIKSRLSRRLQTGDSIIFLVIGSSGGASFADVNVRGLCRYWTKAN